MLIYEVAVMSWVIVNIERVLKGPARSMPSSSLFIF